MSLQEDILDFLFDGAFPAEILKMDDSSEVHVMGAVKRKKEAWDEKTNPQKIAIATNAGGAAAGPSAVYLAAKAAKSNSGGAPRDLARTLGGKHGKSFARYLDAPKTKKAKVAAGAAGAGIVGLQALNWAGDSIATKEMSKPQKQQIAEAKAKKIKKDMELEWEGEISKVDDEKHQVFGWCSLSKVDGQDVIDKQGDFIPVDEMENSAYEYVIHSRKGGDMHKRVGEDPLHSSDMIESFVVTPEKLSKMGLPEDALPHGWWIGFKVNDESLWEEVKDEKKTHFSVHGRGTRVPMEA